MDPLRHVALLAVLLVGPLAGSAQEPSRSARADAIAALPRGGAFTSDGQEWRLVGGARALPRAAHESEEQALARGGASLADVLDRKGGQWLIVRSGAAATATVPAVGYLTAVNGRTGNLGVLSGILEVRTRSGADAQALARSHALEVVSVAPRLSMVFLRVPAGRDLQAAADLVAHDPAVASAEIEVVEHVATPR